MFAGKNNSGKMFEVINEDREVLGAFDSINEAVACGRAAHWTNGVCDIRRDHSATPILARGESHRAARSAFYSASL